MAPRRDAVRFDDSLRTVLAADAGSAFGAQSAFRQLVDLVGRGRVPADGEPLDRLRALRPQVPTAVRAASARALALAAPPAALVALFAEDDPAVVAPVLRSVSLSDDDWLELLPQIGPAGRALLRARRELSPTVARALAAFGATDFTIGHDAPVRAAEPVPATPPAIAADPPVRSPAMPAATPIAQTFNIADLVSRIETFHRDQEQQRPAAAPVRTDLFSFEADTRGTIRWVDGVSRAGLVGTPLADLRHGTSSLRIATGPLAGEWAISAVALYTADFGRLFGYRGNALRVATSADQAIDADALRRLVHELRTPTNAISGFAELIATGMLGPVETAHRLRAETIGRAVRSLIGAIDDLDISARVDGGALDLSPRSIDLGAALAAAVQSAAPDGRVRVVVESGIVVLADDRALDRLLTRLAATVAESMPEGRPVTVTARTDRDGATVTWPWSTAPHDSSLLGADFTLRLARKLAGALGGTLLTEPGRLTLHLPSFFNTPVQATTH